ncbi:hypothetical protein CVIRNUC_004175 [Coccomyxa viridis]|uniref:Uncharacterized protein n=1 Tax=Coccomyxa viridis TaxID=1274662 RepID=A0AAV1I3C2_9CHLO|nr:hypothetical protein CVIRNUC_004175 [Coccomyxa viridis]
MNTMNKDDIEVQGHMIPHKGAGQEDSFECLFESALEEERSLSKTLSLPRTSRSSSNACSGASSLGSSKSGMGTHGSGDVSMGIEQACDSMQDDWKRLLLRMRGPAIQQAQASVGCIQADNDKPAGEEISSVNPPTKQESSESICNSTWSKTTH